MGPNFGGPRAHSDGFVVYDSKELFNLRHSSLRTTIERAFGALKNHFRIIDNKPFYKYKTQVKFVQACCTLHNWILGFRVDYIVPTEETWVPNPVNSLQSQEVPSMVELRDGICEAMWENRATSRT